MISASIMCADLLNLSQDVEQLIKAETDYLHLDIMDGHFVNNITLGLDCCASLASWNYPRDIHLLVESPQNYIDRLNLSFGDIFQVHYEVKPEICELAEQVHQHKAKFGLVLNPETPVNAVSDYLPYIDVITLMMIKPGFSGRQMEAGMIDKIADLKHLLQSTDYSNIAIEVDGNVNVQNVPRMYENGARIFVAGTSSVFRKDTTIEKGINSLRNCV